MGEAYVPYNMEADSLEELVVQVVAKGVYLFTVPFGVEIDDIKYTDIRLRNIFSAKNWFIQVVKKGEHLIQARCS